MPALHGRGYDSIAEFEAAARQRHADARRLRRASHHLGAIYLDGYSIEMRAKAMYFRAAGFPLARHITPGDRRNATRMYLSLGLNVEPGQHDVAGWAQLAVSARATTARPLSVQLGTDIVSHGVTFAGIWSETLRYRSTAPTGRDVRDAMRIADWFDVNYSLMI